MRKALLWAGVVLCVVGIGLVGASVVMSHLGFSPSFNLGDPAKFQFILVPFWQIGLGVAVLGAIAIFAARRMRQQHATAAGGS